MLKNARTLAIVAVHTGENEPLKIWGDLFNFIQFGPYLPRSRFKSQSLSVHVFRIRLNGTPRQDQDRLAEE